MPIVAPPFHPSALYDFRAPYNQRCHPGPPHHLLPPTKLYSVSLKVGAREFLGQGVTRQLARHQAATKALAYLKSLDAADSAQPPSLKRETDSEEVDVGDDQKAWTGSSISLSPRSADAPLATEVSSDVNESFIDPVLRSMQEFSVDDDVGHGDSGDGNDEDANDLNSKVSLVHEIT